MRTKTSHFHPPTIRDTKQSTSFQLQNLPQNQKRKHLRKYTEYRKIYRSTTKGGRQRLQKTPAFCEQRHCLLASVLIQCQIELQEPPKSKKPTNPPNSTNESTKEKKVDKPCTDLRTWPPILHPRTLPR